MLELIAVFIFAFFLCASLDPQFIELMEKNALVLVGASLGVTTLLILSGMIHSTYWKLGYSVNIYIFACYGLGVTGVFLMRRSSRVPVPRRYFLLILGFLLILMASFLLETRLDVEW